MKKEKSQIGSFIFINSSNEAQSYKNFISYNESSLTIKSEEVNFESNERIPYSNPKDHFICKECLKIPNINFNKSLNSIQYSCKCEKSIGSLENIFKKYVEQNRELDENIIIDNLICKNHKEKFAYYCEKCQINLCRKCLRYKMDLHNEHNIYNFDLFMHNLELIKQHFNNILFKPPEQESEPILFVLGIENFINLASVIINDYLCYPNREHFNIIPNIEEFINNSISQSNKINVVEKIVNYKEIVIKSRKELFYNLKINNAEMITEIVIKRSNLNDISAICEFNLKNLKKLELNENCIVDIRKLKDAKFKDIEILNLGSNRISNDNISYLYELYFDKLSVFNLSDNSITSPDIFELTNKNDNLPNLKTFNLSYNLINWQKAKTEKEKKIEYDFSQLEEIVLSDFVFDKSSINFIERFIFNDLKIIDLSNNNFDSLSFVNNLVLPCLETFIIHTSSLTEFYPLKKYKSLKNIDMKENYVSNIKNLRSFLEIMNNLELFDLKENNIDMNDKGNQDILKSIDEIYDKKLKLII